MTGKWFVGDEIEMGREMMFGENEYDRMNYCMTAIMDAGELLAMHGAEVSRVEDTITRQCTAYGFMRADVFTITSSIIVTAMLSDGRTMTQTRRIRTRTTDLEKVAKVNELSRRICADPAEPEELRNGLEAIKNGKRISVSLELGMHMMIASSLSVFFGGTLMDGIAAALSGAVLYATLHGSAVLRLNTIIQNMFCSAVTAISVLLLVKAGIGVQPDKIMIGDIMLVIPGLQLTNSLRDMINGDMISGLLNMSEALLKAVAVAIGFACVIILGGTI